MSERFFPRSLTTSFFFFILDWRLRALEDLMIFSWRGLLTANTFFCCGRFVWFFETGKFEYNIKVCCAEFNVKETLSKLSDIRGIQLYPFAKCLWTQKWIHCMSCFSFSQMRLHNILHLSSNNPQVTKDDILFICEYCHLIIFFILTVILIAGVILMTLTNNASQSRAKLWMLK